jgi:hypothetical protein
MVQETGKTPSAKPALKIDELVGAPADRVVIDGKTYDLESAVSWGLRQRALAQRLWTRITAIEATEPDKIDADLEREYHDRLGEICVMALPGLEPAVLKQLALGQRQAVATTFFARSLQRSGMASFMAATVEAAAAMRTGARSSPASRPRTAGTRRNGS